MRKITEFTEIKAYVDMFNARGHIGFKKSIDPFFWWNHKWPGKIDDSVRAYVDEGLVLVLELDSPIGTNVENFLVFALCPQNKDVLGRILDIIKNYDMIKFNSEFRDRYRSITRRFDGSSYFNNDRHYYCAEGKKAWAHFVKR